MNLLFVVARVGTSRMPLAVPVAITTRMDQHHIIRFARQVINFFLKREVHPKLMTSSLVVFGALSQTVKV